MEGFITIFSITPPQKDGFSLPNNLVLMKQVFSNFSLPFLNVYLVLYVLKHECWLHGVHNTDFEFSKFAILIGPSTRMDVDLKGHL